MKADTDDERRAKMIEFFCRHLVGLCVSYRHKNAADEGAPARFAACSGTLIIIQDTVCFLTAGHVLKELDKLRSSAQVEIATASLLDTLGSNRISDVPVPFDLKNAPMFYIDDDKEGLDFGVIALDRHHVRLLGKNGVIALAEQNWIHQHTLAFDGYAILGLPEELTSGRVLPSGNAFVSPMMLGVKRLESPPEDHAPTSYPQFVGQLGASFTLKSVEGMSGGPIFGFRQEPDGNLRYWIVALQSSWKRDSRVVYGCSLPVLASLMTAWAREHAPAA